MSYQDEIKVGSTVFIGEPAPLDRKTTWRVLRIDQAKEGVVYAYVTSGLSGQHRTVPLEQLRPFRVTEVAR